MLRLLVLLGAIIAAAMAFISMGFGEPETHERCPSCGKRTLATRYRGSGGGPKHLHCESCGAGYRQHGDGPLISTNKGDPLN
jgi:hypothetical protein